VCQLLSLAENAGWPKYQHLAVFHEFLRRAHINKALALEYRRHRQAQNHVSDATVNRDLSVLRHVLYWALDAGLITSNPLARLRMVRERRVPRLVVNVGEELRLLEAAPGHLQRMIIAALDTGMRRGEITHQRWEHVDFDRRILLVTKSKTPEGEAREIPLTARLCRLLEGSRQEQGLIFCYEGRALRNIKTSWRATLRRAKLRHIRFHDLRHSVNCRLMEAGVIQEVRMALMGHSTAGRVHAAYTHVELPAKRRAIAQLEQWLQTQLETKGGTPNGNNTQNG